MCSLSFSKEPIFKTWMLQNMRKPLPLPSMCHFKYVVLTILVILARPTKRSDLDWIFFYILFRESNSNLVLLLASIVPLMNSNYKKCSILPRHLFIYVVWVCTLVHLSKKHLDELWYMGSQHNLRKEHQNALKLSSYKSSILENRPLLAYLLKLLYPVLMFYIYSCRTRILRKELPTLIMGKFLMKLSQEAVVRSVSLRVQK